MPAQPVLAAGEMGAHGGPCALFIVPFDRIGDCQMLAVNTLEVVAARHAVELEGLQA